MKPLSVIVVTHNRLEYTKQTIGSLLATVPDYQKIVIYDNDSTEAGMRQYLTDLALHQRGVYVVFGGTNLGWAGAVNRALMAVDSEFIHISNNDVEYKPGWYEILLALYDKYPLIGIMGVWKHVAHGIYQNGNHGDLIEKDDMPAVGWLMKKAVLDEVGPIPERGPCATKGGNGEDSNYVNMIRAKRFWIAAPKDDVATHLHN